MNTNVHPIIQKFREKFAQRDDKLGFYVVAIGDGEFHAATMEDLESFLLEVDKQAREEEREKINMSFKNLHCLCSEEGKYCKGLSIELSDLQHQERKGE